MGTGDALASGAPSIKMRYHTKESNWDLAFLEEAEFKKKYGMTKSTYERRRKANPQPGVPDRLR